MTDLIVLPTVLPALTAAFLLLAVRYDLKRQRVISVAATAGLLALAIILYGLARDGAPRPYRLGDWPAPFGIVLVLDRLSATMLVLAAALALCVILYAINGWDARGRHFHPLFQFQLARYQRRLSDRRHLQPVRILRGDADRILWAATAWRRPAPAAGGISIRHDQSARLDAVPVRGRPDLRRRRHAQHGRSRGQGAAGRSLGYGAAAHGRTAAVSGFRDQGGARAAALVAAGDLCRRVGSSRGAVHDHDEDRRLCDTARLRHRVRRCRRPARRSCRTVDIARCARHGCARIDRDFGEPDAARPCCLCGRRVNGHAADRDRPLRSGRGHDRALLSFAQHPVGRGAVPACRSDRRAARAHAGSARTGRRNRKPESAGRAVPAWRDRDCRSAAALRIHRQADDPRRKPWGGCRAVGLVRRARHDACYDARLCPRRKCRILEYRSRANRRKRCRVARVICRSP